MPQESRQVLVLTLLWQAVSKPLHVPSRSLRLVEGRQKNMNHHARTSRSLVHAATGHTVVVDCRPASREAGLLASLNIHSTAAGQQQQQCPEDSQMQLLARKQPAEGVVGTSINKGTRSTGC